MKNSRIIYFVVISIYYDILISSSSQFIYDTLISQYMTLHFKTEGLKSFWCIIQFSINRYYMFLEFSGTGSRRTFFRETGELTALFNHYHAHWFSTRARYQRGSTIACMINVLVINCTRRLTRINQVVRRENLTVCTLMYTTPCAK